ncbi:hypothetical protein GCM10010412_094910 [Nonomuraea recticatena]|uniref:Uncharacterized protein n=1 Tax=Nonomuraea recticatena TaxID=46178 RepID=A0ABN3TF35_9ACTN
MVVMVRLQDTTQAKSRTRKVGAVVAAVASVTGMVFAAAPATAAAYPTSTFSIQVGASYYKGTVTWYNRSVGVTGAFKAVGCRRVYADTRIANSGRRLDWQSSSTWCDESGPATLAVNADVPGGATKVNVWMTTGNPNEGLEHFSCYRDFSTCFGPYVGLPQ